MFQGIGMTSSRTRDRLLERLLEQGIRDFRVLDAIRNTPRHIFVDEALSNRAYEDIALPIGFNQTISQPYIVARMTSAVIAHRPKRILEIGTGCGYQTAILARLVAQVYSVERIKPLQEKAQERLHSLSLDNVQYRHADGGFGWMEHAPYEAILCAAAPGEVPDELLLQLAPNGVLVIPVGLFDQQELRCITRQGDTDTFSTDILEVVRFVPFLAGTQV